MKSQVYFVLIHRVDLVVLVHDHAADTGYNSCVSAETRSTSVTTAAKSGGNHTGPPCSVGRPTAHVPGGRPARMPAALQTTTTDAGDRY